MMEGFNVHIVTISRFGMITPNHYFSFSIISRFMRACAHCCACMMMVSLPAVCAVRALASSAFVVAAAERRSVWCGGVVICCCCWWWWLMHFFAFYVFVKNKKQLKS
jgi:hypothetical protein